MSRRVFFYVQHLLGIGHLRRAATLVRALDRSGFDVLLVPFATPRETEQTRRAQVLAERGLVQTVSAEGLDGPTLAAAVDRAMAGRSIRSFPPCDGDGGAKTAALLAAMA